jgi:glycosyltransferase involved in cell wall biosynthesis
MTGTAAGPVVSVVIPAFRASGDIADALASVFAQTFTQTEVIVVNDGSPDTWELESAIAPYRSRLRYIVQGNGGAAAARNSGIRQAAGRYVAFLDADDRWFQGFLASQIAFLDAAPDCALVYTDALITGESDLRGRRFMEQAPSSGPVTLVSLIEQRCNAPMSTVVCRREALFEAGLFDETLRRGHDADLWFRMAMRGMRLCYQRRVLAERRVRADGLSGNAISELQRAINVLDRFGRLHDLPLDARTALRVRLSALLSRLELEQGKQRLAEGNFVAAEYHLSASRVRSLKLRACLVALKIAPSLIRRVYLLMRRQPPLLSERAEVS